MEQNLSAALQITVIGMSLVFMAIILLWGFMALLVRLVRSPSDSKSILSAEELERKRRAAAVAVTLALSQEEEVSFEPQEFPLPPTALVSAWQAVMRTSMLGKRGSRK